MNIFQHKNIIKPPLLPVFISSVIQFDKFFHPVVLYEIFSFAYSWILIKSFVTKEKILEKLRDVHIKWQIFHQPCVPVYQT